VQLVKYLAETSFAENKHSFAFKDDLLKEVLLKELHGVVGLAWP
jgi:hypothetical protein